MEDAGLPEGGRVVPIPAGGRLAALRSEIHSNFEPQCLRLSQQHFVS